MEPSQKLSEATDLPRIKLDTHPESAINRFLSFVKPYKELVLLFVGLGGGALAVNDYFATRTEVGILKCQALAQISALENSIEMERLKARIAIGEAKLGPRPPETKIPVRGDAVQAGEDSAARTEIDSMKYEHKLAHQALATAREQLKPGKCEELEKSK